MKVYKKGDFEVTRLDFCCRSMGDAVLLGAILPHPWTDHPLRFHWGELTLNNCPYCGAVINGDYHPEPEPQAVQIQYPHQDCFYSGGCGCDNHRLDVKPKKRR